MAKMIKFPETFIVHYDTNGGFFICAVNADSASTMEETTLVGVYKLDRLARVVNKTTLEDFKKPSCTAVTLGSLEASVKWKTDLNEKIAKRKKRSPAARRGSRSRAKTKS